MSPGWKPHREPIATVILRTFTLAAFLGAGAAAISGRWTRWPLAALLALWPSFGGHWLEMLFLNWLRPNLPAARPIQVVARVALWFVGGVAFLAAMRATATAFTGFPALGSLPWWAGGLGFIGVELAAHAGLALRGRPSFYDGLG
ncbi:MAG: hypothetical protein U0Q16_28865 [Bryobacteraceae bacterium]